MTATSDMLASVAIEIAAEDAAAAYVFGSADVAELLRTRTGLDAVWLDDPLLDQLLLAAQHVIAVDVELPAEWVRKLRVGRVDRVLTDPHRDAGKVLAQMPAATDAETIAANSRDWLRLVSARRVASSGEAPEAADWPDYGIDEMLEMPPVEWLAEDLLPERSVCVLAGRPGSGKSFLAVDLACRLAHGMGTWLDACLTGHGPVAYVALEGHGGLAGRIRAWRIHHDAERQQHPLRIIVPDDDVAPLSPEAVGSTRERLRRWAERHGAPVLVVIDTATLATDGDENDASTWRAALRASAQIAREHGCTVVLVHHLRKDAQGKAEPLSLSSLRGSGALSGNVDQVLGVEKLDDRCRLAVLKAKDGPEAQPRDYVLDIIQTGIVRRSGKPETSCVVRALGLAERAAADPEARRLAEAHERHLAAEARVETIVQALQQLGGSSSSKRAIILEAGGKYTLMEAALATAIDRDRILIKGARDARRYVLPTSESRVGHTPHTPVVQGARCTPCPDDAPDGEGAQGCTGVHRVHEQSKRQRRRKAQ